MKMTILSILFVLNFGLSFSYGDVTPYKKCIISQGRTYPDFFGPNQPATEYDIELLDADLGKGSDWGVVKFYTTINTDGLGAGIVELKKKRKCDIYIFNEIE